MAGLFWESLPTVFCGIGFSMIRNHAVKNRKHFRLQNKILGARKTISTVSLEERAQGTIDEAILSEHVEKPKKIDTYLSPDYYEEQFYVKNMSSLKLKIRNSMSH